MLSSILCKLIDIWRVNNMEKIPEENNKNKPWDWKEYYDLIGEKGHTKNLEEAISYCEKKDFALDIGAGNLRDTKFLLSNGFEVTAVDISSESERLAKDLNDPKLTMFNGRIGEFEFPGEHFSLVNAQGILFHIHKDRFDFVMKKIKKSLKSGGVLCADFIGEHDDWNYETETKYILTKENLDLLKEDFDIKSLHDYEADESEETREMKAVYKNNPNYKAKHWHHMDIIAVKK